MEQKGKDRSLTVAMAAMAAMVVVVMMMMTTMMIYESASELKHDLKKQIYIIHLSPK